MKILENRERQCDSLHNCSPNVLGVSPLVFFTWMDLMPILLNSGEAMWPILASEIWKWYVYFPGNRLKRLVHFASFLSTMMISSITERGCSTRLFPRTKKTSSKEVANPNWVKNEPLQFWSHLLPKHDFVNPKKKKKKFNFIQHLLQILSCMIFKSTLLGRSLFHMVI